MERIEYFAQEIKEKEAKKEAESVEVRNRILVVWDPVVWEKTYEQIAARAWRSFDVAHIGI